jgi:hypothetical protein
MNSEIFYIVLGITFISTFLSYLSKRLGIVISAIISAISFLFIIGASAMPVANYGLGLIFGFFIFPGLAWFGYWLGQHLQKKNQS